MKSHLLSLKSERMLMAWYCDAEAPVLFIWM